MNLSAAGVNACRAASDLALVRNYGDVFCSPWLGCNELVTNGASRGAQSAPAPVRRLVCAPVRSNRAICVRMQTPFAAGKGRSTYAGIEMNIDPLHLTARDRDSCGQIIREHRTVQGRHRKVIGSGRELNPKSSA